eukprot:Gb_05342 [translate_table: standard]
MSSPQVTRTTPPTTTTNSNHHGSNAARSPASAEAPKSLRGLNKPKCSECGNVARSRTYTVFSLEVGGSNTWLLAWAVRNCIERAFRAVKTSIPQFGKQIHKVGVYVGLRARGMRLPENQTGVISW